MKKPLHIFFEKNQVGILSKKSDDTLSFQYSRKWLDNKNSFSLSPAMPLQEESFNNRLTKAYFDNLLPEGDTLRIFEQILKRSFEDPYQLLESYGLDCAGALEITPMEGAPEDNYSGSLEEIKYSEIDKVIENKESLYVHTLTNHNGRFSLAGAQDKIPVIFQDGRIFLPSDARPTTHILKPPTRISGVLNSVQNEYLCMRLAQLCDLDIPDISLIGEENPLFLIERYDRKIRNNRIERIHQFDLCQAQGYPSAEKYEQDGGPTIIQNYRAIDRISDLRLNDLDIFLKWISFNLLIGNNDSHSKNLSFVRSKNKIFLAPLYDLLSTSIYKNMSQEFAFSIGGQNFSTKLKLKNFELLAKDLGFEKRIDIFTNVLKKMTEKFSDKVQVLWQEVEDDIRFKHVKPVLESEFEKRYNFFQKI